MSSRRELRDLVAAEHRNRGDALLGQRVIAQAREVGRVMVVPGTSTHKMQQVVLRVNVLCVIDQPFQLRDGAARLRDDAARG